MGTEFRPVETADDIRETAKLADEIWHECYAETLTPEQIDYMVANFQSEQAIGQQIGEKGYEYYLVAPAPGARAVGYVGLQAENSRMLLSKIYVQAGSRGGPLTDELFAFMEDVARKRGCTLCWLTVNKYNARAIAAYQKRGYRVARQQVVDIGGGFVMDDNVMEKELA